MNENTTPPNGESESGMAVGHLPADPGIGTDPNTTPPAPPADTPAENPPPVTIPVPPEGDAGLPETGETATGEMTTVPGDDIVTDEGPDPVTCIFFGTTIVLAIVVAVLSVLLIRGRKKKADPSVSPQLSGKLTVGKLHEQGDRESQQDCFAVSPEELAPTRGLLAVVADGMGGLADGDKVSQTAVAAMLDGFLSTGGEPDSLLLALTEQANRQVNRLLGPANIGKSGSTLVAGLIRDGRFHYLSIGDSRICLFRDGQLIQHNREHIYRHELSIQALSGIGSLQGAAAHPKAAGLTSYLGMGQLKYVDIPAQSVEIRGGDKFILMSDGVYNALSEGEIAGALDEGAEKAAEKIGEMIATKAYRNKDNYTAVILAP